MQFIDIPTEQTTAITDVFLFVLAFIVTISVYRSGKETDIIKTRIWVGAFGLLCITAMLGAIAHGIKMSPFTNYLIWQPLNFFLGMAIALFAAGVIYDWKGFVLPRNLFIVLIVAGILFYAITLFVPGSFFVFILYEAAAMIFSLIMYIYLWARRKFPGSLFMVFGILISIIAAVVQAINSLSLTLIWEFDHNGLFHLIQMAGIIFLLKGLQTEFKSRAISPKTNEQ